MTEEVQQALAEVDSAPAAEVTATTEPAQNAPEVAETQTDQPAAKTFTQEELDAAIGSLMANVRWQRQQRVFDDRGCDGLKAWEAHVRLLGRFLFWGDRRL